MNHRNIQPNAHQIELTIDNNVLSDHLESISIGNAGGISGDVVITDNMIGVDVTGQAAMGNADGGIGATVGTDDVDFTITDNVISANGDHGVFLSDLKTADFVFFLYK